MITPLTINAYNGYPEQGNTSYSYPTQAPPPYSSGFSNQGSSSGYLYNTDYSNTSSFRQVNNRNFSRLCVVQFRIPTVLPVFGFNFIRTMQNH